MRSAIQASVGASDLLGSALVCEPHACLGIDLQVVPGAVGDELVRIDYGAHHNGATALRLAFDFLSGVKPLLVSRRELLRVFHDLENARIVLAIVPGETESADRHSGHDQSSIGGLAIADGKGRAGAGIASAPSAPTAVLAIDGHASSHATQAEVASAEIPGDVPCKDFVGLTDDDATEAA